MAQQTFQRKNIFKDFDLSFSRNPLTNDVGKKTDINAISQSLKTLINTNYYERPFQPRIGSNIHSLLFEPADVITIMDLRAAIEETITNYEPRIILDKVKIQDYSEKNAYAVQVLYRINSTNEPQELKITLKRLR